MSVHLAPISESLTSFFSFTEYSKVLVVLDTNTKKWVYPKLISHLPKHKTVVVPAGESHKNLDTCQVIWQAMTDYELDRHSLVLNVGGGVVGDMGGFCAATYKRGIDFIQVPTTLLSQVDASVGGKLGIDFQGFKNHLGSFQLPTQVMIDPSFLSTLPERELRSGFAEIIKHCLIQDGAAWQTLRRLDFPDLDWPHWIQHSVQIKEQVVSQDPTEKGLRKILNFGHTLGHAVETYFLTHGKKPLLHGEAIAVGMIAEAFLAFERKFLDEKSLMEIEEFVFSVFGKAPISGEDIPAILALTTQDKKNRGKEIRFSLLRGLGSCGYDDVMTTSAMRRAMQYYLGGV